MVAKNSSFSFRKFKEKSQMKFKCQNFEDCGNYTNAKHTKWCIFCSFKWQCKQFGYDVLGHFDEGNLGGIILVREDLNKK